MVKDALVVVVVVVVVTVVGIVVIVAVTVTMGNSPANITNTLSSNAAATVIYYN